MITCYQMCSLRNYTSDQSIELPSWCGSLDFELNFTSFLPGTWGGHTRAGFHKRSSQGQTGRCSESPAWVKLLNGLTSCLCIWTVTWVQRSAKHLASSMWDLNNIQLFSFVVISIWMEMLGLWVWRNAVSEHEGCLWFWGFFWMWIWFAQWDEFVGFSAEASWNTELNCYISTCFFTETTWKFSFVDPDLEDHDPFQKTRYVSYLHQNLQNIILSQLSLWTFCHGSFWRVTQNRLSGCEHTSAKLHACLLAQPHWQTQSAKTSPTFAMPDTNQTLAQKENSLGTFKRVRCRMEFILFQFLFIFVHAINHLKEQ